MFQAQQRVKSTNSGNQGVVTGLGYLVEFDNGDTALLAMESLEAVKPTPPKHTPVIGAYVRLRGGQIAKVRHVYADCIYADFLPPSVWDSIRIADDSWLPWTPTAGDRVVSIANGEKVGTVISLCGESDCKLKWDFTLQPEVWNHTMIKPYEQPRFAKDDVVICINPLWSNGLTATVLTQNGGKLWVIWNKQHWKYNGQADGQYSTDSFRHYDSSVMSNAA